MKIRAQRCWSTVSHGLKVQFWIGGGGQRFGSAGARACFNAALLLIGPPDDSFLYAGKMDDQSRTVGQESQGKVPPVWLHHD